MPPGGNGPPPPPIMPMPPGLRPPVAGFLPNHQQIPPPQAWSNTSPPDLTNKPPPQPLQQLPSLSIQSEVNGNSDSGDGSQNGEKIIEENRDGGKCPDVVLPKALEDVLALKDQRAAEFDVNTEDFSNEDLSGQNSTVATGVISNDYADAGEDSDDEGENLVNGGDQSKSGKLSKVEKNKKKKRRKKMNKKLKRQQEISQSEERSKDTETETAEDTEEATESSKKVPDSEKEAKPKESKTKQKDKKRESSKDSDDKESSSADEVTVE